MMLLMFWQMSEAARNNTVQAYAQRGNSVLASMPNSHRAPELSFEPSTATASPPSLALLPPDASASCSGRWLGMLLMARASHSADAVVHTAKPTKAMSDGIQPLVWKSAGICAMAEPHMLFAIKHRPPMKEISLAPKPANLPDALREAARPRLPSPSSGTAAVDGVGASAILRTAVTVKARAARAAEFARGLRETKSAV